MPNWAAATVTTSDGESYGTTAASVSVITRPGVRSIRVMQGGVVIAEKAGIASEGGTSKVRTITFDDGTVWTAQRLRRSGCGCR